ncbi:serine/threonine protein phosphatase [Candidatus Dependentiae bacterium]|nr:serine/threonine protein phosphatase [Candidatus Dependentiae bacterium]
MNLMFLCLLSIAFNLSSMDNDKDSSTQKDTLTIPFKTQLSITQQGAHELEPFKLWFNKCKELPTYKELITNNTLAKDKYASDLPSLVSTFIQFVQVIKQSSLSNPRAWLNNATLCQSDSYFFNIDRHGFAPYVQKLIVPSGSTIALHGDLHGDIHSLNDYLAYLQTQGYFDSNNGFKIIRPDFYMLFLGDYVDRGLYGLEVLYTLMCLKIANPLQVHLIRGNHEDPALNITHGFFSEFQRKFSSRHTDLELQTLMLYLSKMYDFMPLALYLGSGNPTNGTHDFIQCCHGGIEIGYNPRKLLATVETEKYQRLTDLNRISQSSLLDQKLLDKVSFKDTMLLQTKSYQDIGFLWNDFIVDPQGTIEPSLTRGPNIYNFGKQATGQVLNNGSGKTHTLRGIFRGHQHNHCWQPLMELILDRYGLHPEDRGVGKLWRDTTTQNMKLWDGIVCTFLVSPETGYGTPNGDYPGFSYDAFGILKTADTFDQWDLTMHYTGL